MQSPSASDGTPLPNHQQQQLAVVSHARNNPSTTTTTTLASLPSMGYLTVQGFPVQDLVALEKARLENERLALQARVLELQHHQAPLVSVTEALTQANAHQQQQQHQQLGDDFDMDITHVFEDAPQAHAQVPALSPMRGPTHTPTPASSHLQIVPMTPHVVTEDASQLGRFMDDLVGMSSSSSSASAPYVEKERFDKVVSDVGSTVVAHNEYIRLLVDHSKNQRDDLEKLYKVVAELRSTIAHTGRASPAAAVAPAPAPAATPQPSSLAQLEAICVAEAPAPPAESVAVVVTASTPVLVDNTPEPQAEEEALPQPPLEVPSSPPPPPPPSSPPPPSPPPPPASTSRKRPLETAASRKKDLLRRLKKCKALIATDQATAKFGGSTKSSDAKRLNTELADLELQIRTLEREEEAETVDEDEEDGDDCTTVSGVDGTAFVLVRENVPSVVAALAATVRTVRV